MKTSRSLCLRLFQNPNSVVVNSKTFSQRPRFYLTPPLRLIRQERPNGLWPLSTAALFACHNQMVYIRSIQNGVPQPIGPRPTDSLPILWSSYRTPILSSAHPWGCHKIRPVLLSSPNRVLTWLRFVVGRIPSPCVVLPKSEEFGRRASLFLWIIALKQIGFAL